MWGGSEPGRERPAADGASVADSRRAFFSIPDIVSIHLRLNDATRGIITADDLALMRPDSLFVNTARAGLIASGALVAALDTRRPGKAAIDVFDEEPINWARDPLASHPHVVATPHIGFVTEDELNLQFDDVFKQVAAYAAGQPIHMINPEIYDQPR